MLVLVAALILVGVGAVAYTLGVNSGGNNTAAGMPGGAHPVQSPLPSGAAGFPRFGANGQAPVIGTVASKTATTIVVTTTAGKPLTVDVSTTTKYSVRGVASATLSNIAVGDRIAVLGTLNADGSLNATQVVSGVGGFAPGLNPGFGRGRGRYQPSPAPSGPSV